LYYPTVFVIKPTHNWVSTPCRD